ncbi:MAG: division/cell wall cluster transcriptional repressor MraZ [Lachnospiraceae bacterium]|jgi:MraZ protein|nr:division/cell wall cluster transcriptional repressor MraZ [Lachnospiraceae bacterium]MBP5275367.1 division/cell wall cluster transcriptional repressor MraZ [Lachnospiraceae bacterium]MBP5565709.1 division/cell wall cluster transcriptional repressor MraZ [Lachnospiraceae bacterium]MBQ4275359.1 division/cell wall cluster transcriptional repressor MraZ [Lachnospiraceae bacterium]MCR4696295.1 division/cell wall cluster transcriptional repressor MraZ [Lachnospiraceae bacterium]
MGFMAEYQNNMDAKGRVILPIKFRETIGNKFILTKGFDHNLFIYPLDEWKKVEEKLSNLKITNKNSRIIKRLLQGSAVEVEIDNQDRISIPQNLRLYAELEKELLFVGQGEYIEIWAKNKFEEANEYDFSEVAEDIDF